MNWDAIGATAELIGAAAVFVTLIYLAIQTRDNVRVMRARAIWDAQVSFVEVNETLGDGGVVSELIYKLLSEPENLNEYERYLVHRFMRGWFQRMEAQFALYKSGILDEEVWQLRRGYARALLDKPIAGEWWELDKKNSVFTKAFIDSIDSRNAPSLLFGDKPREIESLLFYDLETTGLSGGAGTVAFLAGFGRIEDGAGHLAGYPVYITGIRIGFIKYFLLPEQDQANACMRFPDLTFCGNDWDDVLL